MTLGGIWAVCLGNYPKLSSVMEWCFEEKGVHLPVEESTFVWLGLREALIKVAYLLFSSPETSDTTAARKYVMCLVQISKILYSLDISRSPKQCLQFYNRAFTVHKLHLELLGTAMATQYFYALLLHGTQQHEVVCSRSVNIANEE